MNVRQSELPALIAERQLGVIDAQEVHDRRLMIVDMHRILDEVSPMTVPPFTPPPAIQRLNALPK